MWRKNNTWPRPVAAGSAGSICPRSSIFPHKFSLFYSSTLWYHDANDRARIAEETESEAPRWTWSWCEYHFTTGHLEADHSYQLDREITKSVSLRPGTLRTRGNTFLLVYSDRVFHSPAPVIPSFTALRVTNDTLQLSKAEVSSGTHLTGTP